MILAALAFLTTTLAWTGVAEAADTPRWALLSVAAPFLLIGRAPTPRPSAAACLALFLIVAWASLAWSPSLWDGLDRCWKLSLLAMLAALGASLSDREWRLAVLGFAAGVATNGALAILQWAEWPPALDLIHQIGTPAGTFVNKNRLAEAAALAFVALAATADRRLWWFCPPILAALLLPFSKGAILAAAAPLAILAWRRSVWLFAALAGALGGAVLFLLPRLMSDIGIATRLSLWSDTLAALSPFGRGAGSWPALYPQFQRAHWEKIFSFGLVPEGPHADPLLLAFEFGLAALLLAWPLFVAFREGPDDARAVLLAFCVAGLFAFPLALPASGFIAALAFGRAVRVRAAVRRGNDLRRGDVQGRAGDGLAVGDPEGDRPGRGDIPVLAAFARGAGDDVVADGPGRSHPRARLRQVGAAARAP